MVLTIGERFSIAWHRRIAAGSKQHECGIERRVKTEGGSRVESSEVVRILPDWKCAETWSAEWNRIEADRILAAHNMVEVDGVPVACGGAR